MPSPVAHLFHAYTFLEKHPMIGRAEFMRGCVFPDIRYFAQINRTVTHRKDIALNEVEKERSPWRAGWLFHSWLDEAWTDYFEQYGVDPNDHALDSKRSALKLLEDDQLRRMLSQHLIREMSAAMRAGDEGAQFGVSAREIEAWYGLVADLVLARDSVAAREKLLGAMHVSRMVIRRLERIEAGLRADDAWSDRVRDCRKIIAELY